MKHVIVDTMYLCHRARHSTGGLSHNGQSTGVIYGVLRDIKEMQDRLKPDTFIFTFDSRHSFRREISDTYKSNREARPDDDEFRAEVNRLGAEILPALGFRNVFKVSGYEADDIIASFAQSCQEGHSALICSRDKDLYQLLSDRVAMYKVATPKEPAHIYTAAKFAAEYGIPPSMWAHVKALAGCPSDTVEGVPGIGEKYAVRWMLKDLNKGKKYEALREGAGAALDRNLPLVQLPFRGSEELPTFDTAKIVLHGDNNGNWLKVNDMLGIRRDPRVSEERKEAARRSFISPARKTDPETSQENARTVDHQGILRDVEEVLAGGHEWIALTANEWAGVCVERYGNYSHESYRKAVQHTAQQKGLVVDTGRPRECTVTKKNATTYRKSD